MRINVQKLNWKQARTDAIAFFQIEDKKWISQKQNYYGKGTSLYNASNTLLESGDMQGKNGELFVLYPTKSEAKASRIILAGIGKEEKLSLEGIRRASARIAKKAIGMKSTSVSLYLPHLKGKGGAEVAQAVVEGFVLGTYKFDKFFKIDEPRVTLENLTILSDDADINGSSLNEVKRAAEQAQIISNATNFARDMSNEPSNNKYPEVMGNWAKRVGKESGVKVTVMGPAELNRNKMIGTLNVNKGSEREARFIVMEYRGSRKKNDQPYVLVGKGITFDTGGISIKPAAGMGEMKSDMSGAAAVIATMKAVGDLKLPINVIGLVASAENMPSGTAMRPGDIITYPNGLSVEVDNTDAEGRLVLADALIWADRYKPKSVIDLATLTGACVVALGHVTAGMMGTDDSMMNRLRRSGDYTHERVCELPIYEEYEDLIKSDVADIKNVGGRWAGAITAALFLKRFTNYPWVHLDIAGPARADASGDYISRGGTGVGVRLLTKMLMDEAKA
jgi:leucyl aminopeptidase